MASGLIPQSIIDRATGGPLVSLEKMRITVHFQPELRYTQTDPVTGVTKRIAMIEQLAATKQYDSQHVTRISNGGLLSKTDRADWENQLFGTSHFIDKPADYRPKYGSLAFMSSSKNANYGASQRFGCCHLRLKPEVFQRATFCFPDSCSPPHVVATAKHGSDIISIALEHCPEPEGSASLDWYIEAHVHGPLKLPNDVEAVVLDPSFQGTRIEALARQLGCPVEWHAGYKLNADMLAADEVRAFRGARIAEIAEHTAQDGILTPNMLGKAYEDAAFELQEIKQVWHCLARFGRKGQ